MVRIIFIYVRGSLLYAHNDIRRFTQCEHQLSLY